MSEIHEIRPEDSVSLANLDITSHTYHSLLSDNLHDPWSRPTTSSNAFTTNGYLNAFPSRHSRQSSHIHNTHHRQRRRPRPSVRQSEELKDVYKKIKIFFTIICVVVAAMTVSVLVMNLKIGVFSGDDDERIVAYYISGQGKYEAFSLCAKCSLLKDEQIIRETRSSKNREFCCFRTIGKLIDVFDSFVQQHSIHLLSEDPASNEQTLNGRHGSEHPIRSRNMAHCNLHTTGSAQSEPSALRWSCMKVGFEIEDKQLIIVSVSSYYYIYSHLLLLKPQTDHKVIRSRTGEDKRVLLHMPMSTQGQNSLLEGVFLLMEGDIISVVSTESRINTASTNDFGIFMV
ncbi:uncharacterized protein [Haliotis asinina]|uniref:uncharacterized protein n=1 Tax=Haliotis asinina TaxID=109174 RepID=UPI0035323BB0